jgi:ribosomal protein S18 acetylase RimI-like enzyme
MDTDTSAQNKTGANLPEPTILYRPLEESDFMLFVNIRKEAFQKEPEAFSSDYATYSATPIIDKEHFFEKVINYPFSYVLGAFTEEGDLVGISGFMCHTALKRRHKGILWGMYVRPEFRHHGIANRLAEIVMMSAKEDARCEQVLISVSPPGSLAHHFYERLGFVLYGVEYRALKLEYEYVDEVLMMKVL